MAGAPPCAPAAARNAGAILGVLEYEFAGISRVLEIGSGTGQHAVCFAAALRGLTWQTSDLAESHEAIRRQMEAARLANVFPPLALDMLTAAPDGRRYDAVFSANTMHIMPPAAVERMIAFIAGVLGEEGVFCCYGPFRRKGVFTSDSNEAFDRSLRMQDGRMGLRELESVDALAERAGLARCRVFAMPANNLLIVWRKMRRPAC